MSGEPTLLDHVSNGRSIRDQIVTDFGADSVRLQTNTDNAPDLTAEWRGFTGWAELQAKLDQVIGDLQGLSTPPRAITYTVNFEAEGITAEATASKQFNVRVWFPEPLP